MRGSFIILAILGILACRDDGPTSPVAPHVVPTPIPTIRSTVWGEVVDWATERALIGARVEVLDGSAAGTFVLVTENGGFRRAPGYRMTLPAGTLTLRASFTGYENENKTVSLPTHCVVGGPRAAPDECAIDFHLRPSPSARTQ